MINFIYRSESQIYQVGRFDAQADKIKEKFGEVAHQLALNLEDIAGCVQSFSSSVEATDADWKQINSQLNLQNSLQNPSNSSSSGILRPQSQRVISGANNLNKLPVDVLYTHLGKS